MDLEKLTDRARGFLQAAQTIAVRETSSADYAAHYAKALLDDEQGMAVGLINAAGGDGRSGPARRSTRWSPSSLPYRQRRNAGSWLSTAISFACSTRRRRSRPRRMTATYGRTHPAGYGVAKNTEVGGALAKPA
jgi:ATP-dependent Clp protease ATP-binding subunit ClpB